MTLLLALVGLGLTLGAVAWWHRDRIAIPDAGDPAAGPSARPILPSDDRLPRPGVSQVGTSADPGSSHAPSRPPAAQAARYVGSRACAFCHADQFKLWSGSDHERAMAPASPETVRGDFDAKEFKHFDVTSKIFRRASGFFMTTDNRDGKLETFRIKYTLGYRPLQQYLVEFPDGRVQCLPIAWDTEAKRWFHLYPDEPIPSTDVLHWTRPLQNWNYMCAECHTTNLQKNYRLADNTYHTQFTEMGVGCESCHGPGARHVELAESWKKLLPPGDYGLTVRLKGADPRIEIDFCAPCHARRRIVAGGSEPGKPFLDHYLPELLDTDLYYADGQIRDEDFEYTSFLQSRMYHEKVRCTNCHDPHSARVKFGDNRLCGQCHLPPKYDTKAHHHHPDLTKPGSRCVDCHMPETTYMVVDPRRDHSIRVPRPDLTVALGIPNACTGCHHDQSKGESAAWAEQQVQKWYGPRKGPPHFAHAIDAGRKGKPEGERELAAVVKRRDTRAVVRASALLLLARYRSDESKSAALDGLKDADALVRTAAARSLEWMPPEESRRPLVALLRDPIRAVRVEAARLLSRVPEHLFTDADRKALQAALAEYLAGQETVNDQPAAHLNMGVIHANRGHLARAKQCYLNALGIDPRFVPAWINLGMLYDSLGEKSEAEKQFRKVIELEPKMVEAHYSLGLLLAEDEKRLSEACEHLGAAVKSAPDNPRMQYNYGLSLQRLQRPAAAEEALLAANRLSPGSPEFLKALAIFYLQQKRWEKASAAAQELLRLTPTDPDARELLNYARHGSQQK